MSPRLYRGNLQIGIDPSSHERLRLVNQVHLEDYVASVLASELNTRYIEAAKAQAVCIRTMAIRSQQRNGPDIVVPDGELFQVYAGINPVTETLLAATDQTQGEVLMFDDRLIEAVYSASSGGHTATHSDVWDASSSLSYLQGKEDPYDRNARYHTWEHPGVNRQQLHELLSETYNFEVVEVRIPNGERTAEGRVKKVDLLGADGRTKTVRSNEFRLVVTRGLNDRSILRSSWFDLLPDANRYRFEGRGFGHGVGLNQSGAVEMARMGNVYDEILGYYYSGVQLVSIHTGEVIARPAGLTASALTGPGDGEVIDTLPTNVQQARVEEPPRRRGIRIFKKRKRGESSSSGRIAW